jgi:HK97 family phage prohead protease
MKVEIRNDKVIIEGYVNAVERESRPLITERGRVNEKIKAGTWRKALSRAENVNALLDHRADKVLASTKAGTVTLDEDEIGLRATVVTADAEAMKKAREGKLKGWSFGMYVNEESYEERANQLPLREVSDLDILEISVIDDEMTPCYSATSIEARAGEEKTVEKRSTESKAVVEVTEKDIDYSKYESRIKDLKNKSCTGTT